MQYPSQQGFGESIGRVDFSRNSMRHGNRAIGFPILDSEVWNIDMVGAFSSSKDYLNIQ